MNDFVQSVDIEKSLKTTRAAGTKGYISLESRVTGLFTKASDVFSLGKVIQNVLYTICLRQFIEYPRSNHELYETLMSKFECTINSICAISIKQCSIVISALKEFYSIFEYFDLDPNFDDLIIARVPFAIDLEAKKEKD